MKQLIISTIALLLLSTTMAGIASSKDSAQDKVQTVQQTGAIASLKNAFKFGLNVGWQKSSK